MTALSLQELKAALPEVLLHLDAGEEIAIYEDGREVGKLIGTKDSPRTSGYGCCQDMLVSWIDDDEHLADFAEYMP